MAKTTRDGVTIIIVLFIAWCWLLSHIHLGRVEAKVDAICEAIPECVAQTEGGS